MNGGAEARAFAATRPTLKWFIVIGFVIAVIGGLVTWIVSPAIGIILLWLGLAIASISMVTLLFLWLSDRMLPHPS